MRPPRLPLFALCFCTLPSAIAAVATTSAATVVVANKKPSGRWSKYLDSIYHEADFDDDGTVTFEECYECVLRFYIKLNQSADIAPPSRATVQALFSAADWNHNKQLDQDEFKELASTLANRAGVRLAAHKVVTMLVSPWLATLTVHYLASSQRFHWFRLKLCETVERIVPGASYRDTVKSESFWRLAFLVVFVSQMGNVVLACVDYWLNRYRPFAERMHSNKQRGRWGTFISKITP